MKSNKSQFEQSRGVAQAIAVPMPFVGSCQQLKQLLSRLEDLEVLGDWASITRAARVAVDHSPESHHVASEEEFAEKVSLTLSLTSLSFRALIHAGVSRQDDLWVTRLKSLKKQVQRYHTPQSIRGLVRYHLALAAYWRSKSKYWRSYVHSKQALEMSERKEFVYGESLFSLALSLSYMGRSYDALAYYAEAQRIPSTTAYRRMMSAANEAHERMMMSDVEGVRILLPHLSNERAFRLELQLNILEGDLSKVDRARDSISRKNLGPTESAFSWLPLVEEALVRDPIDTDFLERAMTSVIEHPLFSGTDFGNALSLLYQSFLKNRELPSIDSDFHKQLSLKLNPKDWNDYRHHRILCGAALGPDMKAEFAKLSLSLEHQRILFPLNPIMSQLNQPRSIWHERLGKRIGIIKDQTSALILNPQSRSLTFAGRTVDLNRHPKTYDLLIALAELKPIVEKRELHERITGTRYSARLHDSRLRMLLNRLRERIHHEFGIEFVQMPGDNRIHLQFEIHVAKKESS